MSAEATNEAPLARQARLDAAKRPFSSSQFLLQIERKREPTSGLEPLTCSLRVIIHALLGFA
jgi:hypothetical protein